MLITGNLKSVWHHDEGCGAAPHNTASKEDDMQITRNSIATTAGPSDWFTGAVYIDPVAAPSAGSRLSASSVHFTPGARTAWHTHPHGQTIFVTEGVGRAQRRGGPLEVIRSGDRVFFEPGEEHWHGAAPDRFMTHLALVEVDGQGHSAAWGKHVTDEEYSQQPG
jgi:quercetin dioxygenase-like cupin family protein